MDNEKNLWRYLEDREEQIIAKREELSRELEALREARASIENRQRTKVNDGVQDKLTIKEMIRGALRKNPEGGTSDQIINWIAQLHRTEVARTSLSPQLSRLKSDKEVVLNEENGIWNLTHDVERTYLEDPFEIRARVGSRGVKQFEGIQRRR